MTKESKKEKEKKESEREITNKWILVDLFRKPSFFL